MRFPDRNKCICAFWLKPNRFDSIPIAIRNRSRKVAGHPCKMVRTQNHVKNQEGMKNGHPVMVGIIAWVCPFLRAPPFWHLCSLGMDLVPLTSVGFVLFELVPHFCVVLEGNQKKNQRGGKPHLDLVWSTFVAFGGFPSVPLSFPSYELTSLGYGSKLNHHTIARQRHNVFL